MPRRFHDSINTEPQKDLRSQKRSKNRLAKQTAKYYGYRCVQPGWIDQEYLSMSGLPRNPSYPSPSIFASSDPLLTDAANFKVATWTKRDMWLDRDADIWPLDIRRHKGRRIRDKFCWKWNELEFGRRTKQKSRYLDFATEDGEYLAVDLDLDMDNSVYWDFEEHWFDDPDEIRNDRNERLPRYVSLDGELYTEDIPDEVDSEYADSLCERELRQLYYDTSDGDDFSIISELELLDTQSSASIEDDYEMI
ncbi:hypothetical protein AYO21_06040 [Fonsecaea monophora]|uniref:Uncharacterized protein n=1 Tax=Fonsecaea monophora TaxID=254056 RepID=A0A177F6C5_9EURO|nr:hypothetical protein AYO21_06040 [Fonsecaea monophora]KAH0832566.1 hypothetical protein FOPE_01228 [Fonsecaea pedrosoi]OAG39765.1 hypothetical protein AYO21_06040 [Fonsecaea monophora]